ncbi:hypothetical protein BpHYR1_050091 [Brachionus plicatilis]|uniref:Uncharacterized protein n=1 Tax=Brachionus plicatilis TaxID=10195 RepID=A0A3M7QVG7_BRAPC|nr:hypothetical protein BpHYR1_050091 [Brachionus plicatilis]
MEREQKRTRQATDYIINIIINNFENLRNGSGISIWIKEGIEIEQNIFMVQRGSEGSSILLSKN